MSVMISPRDVNVSSRRLGFARALAAVVWLGVASNCPAQNLDMWGTDGGPGTPTLTSQSAFGVTLGTNALQATNPQGSFWGPSTGNLIGQGFYNQLKNATTISFDLTMIGAQINGGSGNFNGFAQSNEMAIQLFSNAGGSFPTQLNVFSQASFTAASGTDSLNQGAGWNGVDGTRTLTYSLAAFTGTDTDGMTKTIGAILAAHPDIADAKISFVEQFGSGTTTVGPGNFFFDNVQLTGPGGSTIIGNFEPLPEPSTMALAALFVPPLAAVIRRRRRPVACPDPSLANPVTP
jgi:hypothetical protein